MVDDLAVVDTDVYSRVILSARDRDPRVARWRRLLLGRQVLIAAQTEGELRFGALARDWGAPRKKALDAQLQRTPTLPVTADVIYAFANVRAGCKKIGQPLADKQHMGDAWIAATALAYGLPLLSGDAIYAGVEGLDLLDGDDDAHRLGDEL